MDNNTEDKTREDIFEKIIDTIAKDMPNESVIGRWNYFQILNYNRGMGKKRAH